MNDKGIGFCEHEVMVQDDTVLLFNSDDCHYVQEFNSWAEIENFISNLRSVADQAFGIRQAAELKNGHFYWVLPTVDVDSDEEWVDKQQPALYAGDDKWILLGTESDTEWPVRWVGPEIRQHRPPK